MGCCPFTLAGAYQVVESVPERGQDQAFTPLARVVWRAVDCARTAPAADRSGSGFGWATADHLRLARAKGRDK